MKRSAVLQLLFLAGSHDEIPVTNTTDYFVNASKWLII
jgi:hypothetical protein